MDLVSDWILQCNWVVDHPIKLANDPSSLWCFFFGAFLLLLVDCSDEDGLGFGWIVHPMAYFLASRMLAMLYFNSCKVESQENLKYQKIKAFKINKLCSLKETTAFDLFF